MTSANLDTEDTARRRALCKIGLSMCVAMTLATAVFLAALYIVVDRHMGPAALVVLILGYQLVLGLCGWWAFKSSAPYSRRPVSLAAKRYMWRFIPAMTCYVVILTASIWIRVEHHPAGLLIWLIAIAPAIPLLFAIRAVSLYLKEEEDEFQRTVQISAYLWATGLTLGVCTVWGFLEMFDLAPHIEAWAVFPLHAACFAPAQIVARWKYR